MTLGGLASVIISAPQADYNIIMGRKERRELSQGDMGGAPTAN